MADKTQHLDKAMDEAGISDHQRRHVILWLQTHTPDVPRPNSWDALFEADQSTSLAEGDRLPGNLVVMSTAQCNTLLSDQQELRDARSRIIDLHDALGQVVLQWEAGTASSSQALTDLYQILDQSRTED